jgi:surfeit locus 1 family protein
MLRIRFWPAFAVLAVVAITIRLGFWQLDRAHQKEALAAHIAHFQQAAPIDAGARDLNAEAVEFHPVRARGVFMPEQVVYLDNRSNQDAPGFHVVMPMRLDGGGYVLVNRGWLPRNLADRTAIAPYVTPSDAVTIEGIARNTPGRAFELGQGGSQAKMKIRQNLVPQDYAAETGLPLQPFVIMQTSALKDGLVRDWPAPDATAARNYGYVFQWWAMAAVALCFGLYAARRAARQGVDEARPAPR